MSSPGVTNPGTDSRLRRIGSRLFVAPKPMDNAALYNGFANALATAVEMVLTPALFLLAGWWLDSRLGTTPVLAVVFAVFAFAGVIVKVYYTYRAEIARQEEGKPWTR